MSVIYEWDCEAVAAVDSADLAVGDVVDHFHGESYKKVLDWSIKFPAGPGLKYELVLVRDDEAGRSWAYVENGQLPERFTDANGDDAAKVPQRFHKEVST